MSEDDKQFSRMFLAALLAGLVVEFIAGYVR